VFNDKEDGDRDEYAPTDFDGDVCHFCNFSENDHPSIRCGNCVWPMMCSQTSAIGRKTSGKGKHGFCQHCVTIFEKDMEPEEVYNEHEIPMRLDPGDGEGFIEREHLHPFHMCDCGICAWCGDEKDDCCEDHVYQSCSCYPEGV
jgi:hypothetical protein